MSSVIDWTISTLRHLGKLFGKLSKEALRRPGASLAKGADRATRDIISDVFERTGVRATSAAVEHAGGDL